MSFLQAREAAKSKKSYLLLRMLFYEWEITIVQIRFLNLRLKSLKYLRTFNLSSKIRRAYKKSVSVFLLKATTCSLIGIN